MGCNKIGAAGVPRAGGSGCFYRLGAKLGADCASEPLEQHYNAILVTQLDQRADHILERARGHPHKITEPQRLLRIESVEVASRLPCSDRGDDFGRYSGWLITSADDVSDPES